MKQPPVIRQLPDRIANQIAAGEVVERPAAVVKELAENSIDAGATRITVRIEDGGRRLVEIEDDGCGMRRDDLKLALSRHATSKLVDADDLFRIATLGFRGEALPSIAAVSEFEMISRPHDADQGWRLHLEAGEERAFEPCALSPGTRISVRNLFWNVPARLKFLKTEASETGHVTDQVMRLALSHPEIAFRLESNGQTVFDLPPKETLERRVRALFGKELASHLVAVAHTTDTMQLTGFVGHPQEARPTSKRQFLFLNGRFVRDKLLLAAVREGYKGFLEPRLHGTVFLHLDVDPAAVDVNVHPTKSEVRFRREGEVFVLMRDGIQKALSADGRGFSLLGDEPTTRPTPASPVVARQVVKAPVIPQPPTVVVQERFLPQDVSGTPSGVWGLGSGVATADHNPHQQDRRSSATNEAVIPARDEGDRQPIKPKPERSVQRAAEPAAIYDAPASTPIPHGMSSSAPASRPTPDPRPQTPDSQKERRSIPGLRRVLQLNRMYLLIETDQGIRLVDQHALHEKALFLCLDPARGDFNRGGRQELLVPITVELLASEIAVLASLLPELAAYGIDAEIFGPTSLLVRAHPAMLKRLNWSRFFADLAEDGSTKCAREQLSERITHRAACHAAVKAGQELSPDEQMELVRLLYEMDGVEHCPHGRPTTLDLPWTELERRFQR
jgi:DNA mismatch repair protein MutL